MLSQSNWQRAPFMPLLLKSRSSCHRPSVPACPLLSKSASATQVQRRPCSPSGQRRPLPAETSVAPPIERAGPADAPYSVPGGPGLFKGVLADVVVAPFNDVEATSGIV